MARQTRRRRDSKVKSRFKNRPTPSISRGTSADNEKLGTTMKSSKVDWRTVGLLVLIFVFSLYIRTAWTAEPATEDGYQLTGGSDPYYHKHVVDYVAENGEHLERDPMLNYPYGANNNRPPLFDWSIAIVGLILSPFFSSTEDSVWYAMQVLPALYGALIVFPVYAIGRAQFGKEAGLIGAFLIGVNSGHVSHSSLALADHDSYIILFGTTTFFFFMRALTVSNDKKWVSDWTDFDSIKQGLSEFVKNERLALGYAGLSGMTIAMIAMSWKGFPYIMAIIAIYLGFQMLINAFRRVDSLTTGMLGLVTLSLPVLLSYPYYQTMGFVNTWWEAPAYILLGYIIMSILMVTTRDLPWLLVIGSSTFIALTFYLLLKYVFTELGFLLFSGQGYFVRTKLFNTIAEAQPPEFADFVFAFGPVSIWLAIFGVVWMAYQLFNQSIWKKDYLFVMIWALVSLYMAQSAVRFIFNATPIVSLISGWMTWLIIQWANFPSVLQTWTSYWGKRGNLFYGLSLLSLAIGFWFFFTISVLVGFLTAIILIVLIMVIGHMDAQDIDQYRFRDRLSGLRKSFDMKRPLVALFVGLFIFLPNTFYGYDAGVPYEDKKEHDNDIYNFLSYDFFRPEEFDYGQRNNVTLYPDGTSGMYSTNLSSNQLWYMGNTGPSFPSDYWIEGLEWLAEQDTEKAPEDRPGFMAWWDYGFWAIDIGEHPTVADNFQFGYQIAGNFIASQSEHEAMSLLLYRILETEVNRDTGKFNSEVRTKLLDGYLNEENVSAFEHIVSNPNDYIDLYPQTENADGGKQDINNRNAAIRTGNPILMTMDTTTISDLLWEVEQITGKSIRYFAADTRMMAYGSKPGQTGILYAPITLADYEINDFVEVQYTLSNGQTLPADEISELVKTNPTLTIDNDVLVYKEKFLNSMFFRAFIGWSAPDIGRPIEDGIPGITGSIAQEGKSPAPGWNLTHFKLVKSGGGNQLRMLKYYDGATIQGTVATPNGDPVANANVTVLDEFGIPHGMATTDKDGKYSVLSVAGNVTLIVSLGELISDDEKIRKVSNNILTATSADDLLNVNISEDAAMRVPSVNSTFDIDIEIEATNITGRLFWDMDKDGTFSGVIDEALPITPVKATNIRSEIETIVNTNANGKYEFIGLAPGEYRITTEVNDHEVVLASYLGTSATRAGQEIEISEALKPSSIWGEFVSADEIGTTEVTVSLYDKTNGSLLQSTFLNQDYLDSECPNEEDTRLVSFCFEQLLPGNYTLRLENDGLLADNPANWANNSIDIVLEKGSSKGYNATLRNGFRLEGTLSHDGEGIAEEQISITNADFRASSYNVFTNEDGYFATVLPEGTYDLFTLYQKENNTLAYLERIDSNTVSIPLDAAMGQGYIVEGMLFEDINGNKTLDENEKGFEEYRIDFDSVTGGKVTTNSGFNGEYDLILPAGVYNAYAPIGGEGQNLVALQTVSLGDKDTNENLSSNYGQDLMVIMYEEHLGSEIPLTGLVNLDGETGALNVWASNPSSIITLPIDTYEINAVKYGYNLEKIYEVSSDTNYTKNEIANLELNAGKELIVEMKRITTDVTGVFSYEGNGISDASISFSPLVNLSYYLNFSTDENGNLANVVLPPDSYLYTFSYDDNGTRYFALGQIDIEIGQATLDLGTIVAEKKYDVGGLATLNDIPEDGMVTFTSMIDLDDATTFEVTKFGGYSGSLLPGNYYVTFQDGQTTDHYSFIGQITLNEPKEYNLTLKDEGYFRGEVISSADNALIQSSAIEILFESEDNVIFVTETIADEGLFGSTDYGKIDLPNGAYTVTVDLEGYESFEDIFIVNGNTDKYTITLDPIEVEVTLVVTYTNATGIKLPVTNADVRFTDDSVDFDETYTTDENGTIIQNMLPRDYNIEMIHYKNGDEEIFKLENEILYVEAGKDKTFQRSADWRVKLSGTVFYDRDFNGVADSDDLLANSEIEIWNMAGTNVQFNTTADENGEYELYLYTGAYQYWIYTNEDTSYVDIAELELEGALSLNASLNRGINFKQTYLSSADSEVITFSDIEMDGANFSFEIEMEDGIIDITVPDGIYNLVSEYEDLSGEDDYVYNLNDIANITDEKDGILQNKTIERKLMRGIDVNVDRTEANVALGQTVTFNFNGSAIGHMNTIYQLEIDTIPNNWTAEFVPNKWGVNYGENVTAELKITPDQTVTVNEKETFSVTVSWTDGSANQVDDITHTFDIGVTPIEAQNPDYVVSELLWNPENPTVGTQVTLTATITNLINNTGQNDVSVVFYDGETPFNTTTILFEGTDNEERIVTATWTATKGSHPLRVAIVDPANSLNEVNTDNNEKSITISVSSVSDDDDNSFRMIALVVVGLVGGLAYVSYRSKRT